jgi:hypothetical protein
MKFVKQCLLWVSALAALASALLWWWSASAKVEAQPRRDESGLSAFTHTDTSDNSDVHLTLREQAKWNARAAYVACFAASIQGISMLIPD